MFPVPFSLVEKIKNFSTIGGNSGSNSGSNRENDPLVMPFDLDVYEQIDKLDLFLQSQCAPTDVMRAVYNRETENTIKLALIHAASMGNRTVGMESFGWASSIMRWSTQTIITQMERHVSDNVQERHVKMIIRLIGDGITRNELTRKTQTLTRRERDSILADLIESGQIVAEMKESDGKKRAPLVYLKA